MNGTRRAACDEAADGVFEAAFGDVRDIRPGMLDGAGRPRILPAAFYAGTTRPERFRAGALSGLYSFPTRELAIWLRRFIGSRRAIEIGAGNGVLAQELGIVATDNRMQDDPLLSRLWTHRGQATVPYGPNIVAMDAVSAVKHYAPEVVVACWCSHLNTSDEEADDGSMFGIDEDAILDNGVGYVFVGNEMVHAKKRIRARAHRIAHPPWLYSRAVNPSPDFIATWNC